MLRLAIPAVTLVLIGACGEDPPPARPKVPVVSGPIVEHADASAGVGFAEASFPCCATPETSAAVGAYVGLGEALAADDKAAATERTAALAQAMAALPAETGSAAGMVELVGRMQGQDLDGIREEFLDLTTPMLELARAERAASGPVKVAVAFCPMKPGRWLQVADGIKNPYYGASMLTCGVFEAP